jgi:fatty-acyl-CoA synthase
MPAPDAAALLRRNGASPEIGSRPAIRFGEDIWTHADLATEGARWANLFLAHQAGRAGDADRPLHAGVLMDNTPDYLFALAGAAYAGCTLVGLNPTRVGEHLQRDIDHTDIDLVVTEPGRLDGFAGVELGHRRVLVSHRFAEAVGGRQDDLDAALGEVGAEDPGLEHDPATRWVLVFTSGTSGAPKAVICSQRRILVTGARMSITMDLGPDDIGYIAMPLFHSNSLMVGWAPSIVVGASVGLARRFSVSSFLTDIRRYGSTWFNYTGKPLSYVLASPEQADDADNTLRVAFGNEGSPQVIEDFGRRFGLEVIDAFGSTEGGIALNRDGPARSGAMGVAGPTIRIVDEDGEECPPARFDPDGRLANTDECVGEIVNTAGAGPFEGYYNNDEATGRATRNGWYWSGDLGYLDDQRYLFFAGRNADWIRVDGENFPAGPIADALSRHPDVVVAVAYGVPDAQAGDQVMAGLVLRSDRAFDPEAFARWLDGDAGIGPKWKPRYVRVADALPGTGTNKVVTRVLAGQKFRLDRVGDDELWVRGRGEARYTRFDTDAAKVLHDEFVAAGRERFWDL